MRRITAILLLFALLFQGFGHWAAYSLQRRQFRTQMKDFLRHAHDPDLFVQIDIRPGQEARLQWEHSREFSLDGILYDVLATTELPGGGKSYRCIPDHDESAWLGGHRALVAQAGKQGRPLHPAARLLKTLFGMYCPPAPFTWQPDVARATPKFHARPQAFPGPHRDILTPPPLA